MGIFNRHRHLKPEILSEFLDGRLDQHHQELADRRLAECPACREELNTLEATVSALQNLPDLPLPRSFTLPAAPSPGYPAELVRKPAPPASLVMKMPTWAYGSAASLAGLALALMLSVEAAGLGSPASFETAGQTGGQITSQAPAAPEDAAMAKETRLEAEQAVPEMASQPEAPTDTQAATPPQAALRANAAPTSQAATGIGETALAEKSLAESADQAPEITMAESTADVESPPGPAGAGAATFAGTPSPDPKRDAETPSDVAASLKQDSLPAAPAEEVTVEPADSDKTLERTVAAPDKNLIVPSEEYSGPSSPTWWKALEIMLATLTLVFLGGLFFRWRRNRGQSVA